MEPSGFISPRKVVESCEYSMNNIGDGYPVVCFEGSLNGEGCLNKSSEWRALPFASYGMQETLRFAAFAASRTTNVGIFRIKQSAVGVLVFCRYD